MITFYEVQEQCRNQYRSEGTKHQPYLGLEWGVTLSSQAGAPARGCTCKVRGTEAAGTGSALGGPRGHRLEKTRSTGAEGLPERRTGSQARHSISSCPKGTRRGGCRRDAPKCQPQCLQRHRTDSSLRSNTAQWGGRRENVSPAYAHSQSIKFPAYTNCQRKESILFLYLVHSFRHIQLFATPWTTVHQTSLSITNSWSLLKLMAIESVMPSNHLILCLPLLLLPSIFPSIRVFSNESDLCIRWSKCSGVSASASVLPVNIQD